MSVAVSRTESEAALARLAPPESPPDVWSPEERRAAVDAHREAAEGYRTRLAPVDWDACERAARGRVDIMRGNAPEVCP